jgi:ABC-2 type transport system ATP-binding protein
MSIDRSAGAKGRRSAVTQSAVELNELRKVFGVRDPEPGLARAVRELFSAPKHEVVAIADVSFRIEPGERVALVGSEGAGKTTLLKLLSGILYPTSGEVRVSGLVPWKERRSLGYRIGTVFDGSSQLWGDLPVSDTLELLTRVTDPDPSSFARRQSFLVEAFGIGDCLPKLVRGLSASERRRCEVVASLLHSPVIHFLDEPGRGLDASQRAVLREIVRGESEREGRTVLLTSNDRVDLEEICDRVIAIHAGRVVFDGPVEGLRASLMPRKRVNLTTSEPGIDLALPGVTVEERSSDHVAVEVDTRIIPVDVVVKTARSRADVSNLSIEEPSMKDMIREIGKKGNKLSL